MCLISRVGNDLSQGLRQSSAAGIDCCVLANNHVLDWGYSGLEETLDTLRKAGLQTSGASRSTKSDEKTPLDSIHARSWDEQHNIDVIRVSVKTKNLAETDAVFYTDPIY
jgi:poly-gamma-glutamate capsule biosynthesis protein CapA/YwtB (metallophosphatase superfamily)